MATGEKERKTRKPSLEVAPWNDHFVYGTKVMLGRPTVAYLLKKKNVKVAHTRLPSVWFGS